MLIDKDLRLTVDPHYDQPVQKIEAKMIWALAHEVQGVFVIIIWLKVQVRGREPKASIIIKGRTPSFLLFFYKVG